MKAVFFFEDLFGIRWLFAWGKGTTAKQNFGAAILLVDFFIGSIHSYGKERGHHN